MFNLSRTVGAIAICAASLVSLSAAARSPVIVTAPRLSSDIPRQHVSFADLNLARQEGQKTLNLRVDVAIEGVCSASGWQANEKGFLDCRYHAWTGARPQIATAVRRATEIATSGHSALPVAAILVVAH